MAASAYRDTFPRGALLGAAGLIALSFVAALTGRLTGIGSAPLAPLAAVESRDLRFEDRADGAVVIREASSDRIVDVLAPQTNHFVRGTLRGFARGRKRENIGAEPPFRLSRLADGRLTLEDPALNRRMDLDAFGRSNVGAFAAIMDAAMKVQ